ncbi:glycosyl transferase family 1 [Ulvibacter sp. MAR_2010_11]|uniref:glycosyltransferase family 4 protein n=1 Tax=Ulvibacter sp. MAR_2010_11 TaxID=1250229 RepID=UPI000C2C3CD4|nr:glycosyltransferase family 4 protein [Ulvibacter sp. MAR_2010_11]PKA84040.1 glycosyl transferase family 1 [Ulvibacter sp. MAR_2010_11]
MKRALVITYYWPPAGGPGVQRWLKFVTYFKEFGIEPIVYIPENPHYPLIDETFVAEVPKDVEIISLPIKEPYRFAGLLSKKKTKQISSGIIAKKESSFLEKMLLYIRGNYFIPDARVGWVQPSVRFLKEYLSKNPVDVIITSGPPHSLHLIGIELKKQLNVTWMADFRDPWTTIHYHKSLRLTESSERKHKALEAKVLDTANLVVVTSPTTKAEFGMITDTPIEVVTNGYDISEKINVRLDTKFSLAHIGSLLSERNPKVLWKVLAEIASENDMFKKDLVLKLAGTVSEDILASIEKYKLKDNLEILGYVSHSEALQLQHKAQVLLLIEMDRPETRSIIPGKLFEYLAAKRPIIAIGPQGSDMAGIVSETGSGAFFTYYNEEELKLEILRLYTRYSEGTLTQISSSVEAFSRRELTSRMAQIIKSIC